MERQNHCSPTDVQYITVSITGGGRGRRIREAPEFQFPDSEVFDQKTNFRKMISNFC